MVENLFVLFRGYFSQVASDPSLVGHACVQLIQNEMRKGQYA